MRWLRLVMPVLSAVPVSSLVQSGSVLQTKGGVADQPETAPPPGQEGRGGIIQPSGKNDLRLDDDHGCGAALAL
jgi:hypothetical protein